MSDPASTPFTQAGRILFVDDDADVVKAAALLLSRHGLSVASARDPMEARSRLATEPVDVVLLDLNFSRGATSGEEGLRCLEQVLADDPQAVVVVVTAHSGISMAVRAMQAGASDFVVKPWNNARLLATVNDALALRRRRRGSSDGGSETLEPEPMILGESPAIDRLRHLIARAAPTDAPVLVLGEAGTGKSLVARRIHLASPRSAAPIVTVDLAALDEAEASRLLFGGAADASNGGMVQPNGGTVVLEEVADLTPALQRRLASALARGGAGAARIISTSRRTRAALQGRTGLSDELLYLLGTVEVTLPPIAQRSGDALLLAEHFLRVAARRHRRPLKPLSEAATASVLASPWLGGVRALRQAMERCVILADGDAYQPADFGLEPVLEAPSIVPESESKLELSERVLVAAALKRHGFNVSHAARELGLTRPALYRRMAKHGL